MRIYVKQVGYEGQVWDRPFAAGEIGLEGGAIRYKDPLRLSAKIDRAGDTLLVQATVSFDCTSACARCLEPARSHQTVRLNLDFEVEPTTDVVDISEDLRQEILLKAPGRIFCRVDCRGLCPDCGANLNQKTCDCSRRREEPMRIRGLGNIKIEEGRKT